MGDKLFYIVFKFIKLYCNKCFDCFYCQVMHFIKYFDVDSYI